MGVRVKWLSDDRLHQMVELEKYTKIENEFTNMAKELLAAREKIKAAEKVMPLAWKFTDMPCYCDDAVLNNGTGICTPCELRFEIQAYRKAGESEGDDES